MPGPKTDSANSSKDGCLSWTKLKVGKADSLEVWHSSVDMESEESEGACESRAPLASASWSMLSSWNESD